ncbi:type I-G CRISPR-associated protein Csb2 [Oceanibacterium hippocampi]|uniref:CRISPR-associated protein, family (Cas_GSU0054) n=1 Tax=Oceanibacterium hippocampi TaxID=745714 RepID=A0A1Y5U5V6_9PROT|nr:type I-U CRISPR-associated protein Csb2 [Oceanibacterium hippocampi]SLN77784.1 CRISPR-associated protein, family (Cas_GSU0054) [Oceanibacterium hippocampi]
MTRALLVTVRFHDGRYHGTGPWPPAPARLFQALVAGAAEGGTFPPGAMAGLAWLERLSPPEIVAPPAREGQAYRNYVPNNDLDAKGGDPGRVAEIRAPKQIRPRLFDATSPILYLWRFENQSEEARHVVSLAKRLSQLGRGVDMAWASAELLDEDEGLRRLADHGGAISRPARGRGQLLDCPAAGSLESLIERHKAMRSRLRTEKSGKGTQQLFVQPPRARFARVAYDSPIERRLFELRDLAANAAFHPWPLTGAAGLVERARDAAATRLRAAREPTAGGSQADSLVERVFGRCRDSGKADLSARIRIVPIPSIGHPHAESSIRRLLLEIPPDCPLPHGDIVWAFSSLRLVEEHDAGTGEILKDVCMVEAVETGMLRHYGIAQAETGARRSRLWRTVTPAALPDRAARRRIDPARTRETVKDAGVRNREETIARAAVAEALRHAGVNAAPVSIRVQREPFHDRGARAESFAPETRFRKERLWHVELEFTRPVAGPLVIGDGRFLGLGLMSRHEKASRPAAAFAIGSTDPVPVGERDRVLHALRRALMAIDRDASGSDRPGTLFSGHLPDGAPAGDGAHRHVFLAADTTLDGSHLSRLYVVRPDCADRSADLPKEDRARFARVLARLATVRAGPLGLLPLAPVVADDDRILATAVRWESITDYRPTRLPGRGKDRALALTDDILAECRRRKLPTPAVKILCQHAGPNGGNPTARLRLDFAVAVPGPIMLGRDSHRGGGLFAARDDDGHERP